ncbi:MAG: serine protease, partial [Microcystis panniformis]
MLTPESLPSYTVRLKLIYGSGTGFFVGQGLILTCLHVVKDVRDNRETIEIIWQGKMSSAKIIDLPNLDEIDLALLQLNSPLDHKYVDFDQDLQLTDKLYTFGYTNDYPNGDPSDFEYIGLTGDENPLIKFKLGQVQPGFSGSPLLNLRTGKVCG